MAPYFYLWVEWVEELQDERTAVHRAKRRMGRVRSLAAFTRWKTTVAAARADSRVNGALRRQADRALRRTLGRCVSNVFAAWAEQAAASKVRQRGLRRVAGRWGQRRLSAGFWQGLALVPTFQLYLSHIVTVLSPEPHPTHPPKSTYVELKGMLA